MAQLSHSAHSCQTDYLGISDIMYTMMTVWWWWWSVGYLFRVSQNQLQSGALEPVVCLKSRAAVLVVSCVRAVSC